MQQPYTWDNQPHKKSTDDQVHVVGTRNHRMEIDVDELRVAASRLADVEFRPFCSVRQLQMFPKGYMWPYRVHHF